jgi:flagellar biosynthesis chaperone FliJ
VKHYKTLIKLKQKEIDNLTKQIGNLRQQRAILEQVIEHLQTELEQEIASAGALVQLGAFFGDYSDANQKKQLDVLEKIYIIDQNIDAVTDKMMIIYGEKKKFEIAMQRKIEELAYLANLREQQFMDELSITRYSQI